ncbi:uncharacterized protein LOC117124931 [Anneissia japonica]|uniref:uncharacterized protein LOC117124931 n=1 Tax=Anneissia japonica TaxID=1529436 RepID=UPI0014259697|nr:uncharacterized protein LOC117124931 [Anneissia japonica]
MFTGKEGVGKSCLVNSLLGKPFNEDEPSTSGIEVLTTIAFGCNEWKEATEDIDDCERTKQILESTVECKVAEKLKQTNRQTEALEQAASTSTVSYYTSRM